MSVIPSQWSRHSCDHLPMGLSLALQALTPPLPAHPCAHLMLTVVPTSLTSSMCTQQRHGNDNNTTIITLRLPQHCHHHSPTSFSLLCLLDVHLIPPFKPAYPCMCNSDVTTMMMQQSCGCDCRVVIVTTILWHTYMPCITFCPWHVYACPCSILGNYLMPLICMIPKMEISLIICFFCFSSASFLYFISPVCRYILWYIVWACHLCPERFHKLIMKIW